MFWVYLDVLRLIKYQGETSMLGISEVVRVDENIRE